MQASRCVIVISWSFRPSSNIDSNTSLALAVYSLWSFSRLSAERSLVLKHDDRTVTRYVRKDRLEEVRGWLKQYKRVKRLVQEISDLTVELLVSEAHASRQQKRRKPRT
jgi:hypothetical protein